MNKAKRIENTNNKFISRIKMWFQIEGRIRNKTWKEYLENNRWLYQHKHNKLKHRSNMSNMEKHLRNKQIRQETYNIIRKDIDESSKDISTMNDFVMSDDNISKIMEKLNRETTNKNSKYARVDEGFTEN